MELKEGDKAPAFKGLDQDGNAIALKDFKGKKLAVYFYPKDNTPTCTTQACNLRDNYSALAKEGIFIVGVSTDTVKSHKKFESKFNLPFPIIADEDKKIVNQFGVWGPKKFMGISFTGTHRYTFLIDEKGIVRHIIKKPKSKNHSQEILEAWKTLDK